MAIESENDRIGLGLDDLQSVIINAITVSIPIAETPLDVLQSGPGDSDGWLEGLMTDAQITATSATEGDAATIGGLPYTLRKIDPDVAFLYGEGGINVCYFEAQ